MDLSNFKKTKANKRRKRVGRGPGSKMGKTSCRGHKGDKSRSGYKRRAGKEGGQLPLFQKLPHRGFSNAQFKTKIFEINLTQIERLFKDGDLVSRETLMEKGFPLRRVTGGIKILSNGDLTKKVTIEASKFSKTAQDKLIALGLEIKTV